MTEVDACELFAEEVSFYVEGKLSAQRRAEVKLHLAGCAFCRDGLEQFRAVQGLAQYIQLAPATSVQPAVSAALPQATQERARLPLLSSAPWWIVSLSMHVLLIALASLISMAIEMPGGNDAVIMITELQPRAKAADEERKETKSDSTDVLEHKETTATDLNSKANSEIVVPPDILARAELGDHFETIDPDRADTHSAYGSPDVTSFHSSEGNAEAAGGSGLGGLGMDDLIGYGGAGSKGSGGGFGGGDGTGTGTGRGPGHGGFGQRSGGGRKLMVKRHGGSAASEGAVDKALQWLAYHQEADGHWDAVKFKASDKCDTAVTGLALLAFLGAGHTEKVGAYRDNVRKAVAWLISKQADNGMIYDSTDNCKSAYAIGIASLAIAEAAGMAKVDETRAAAQKAVNYCTEIHQQGSGSEKGGWRYVAKQEPDISVTGWFVMALKSAKVAGLHVDPASFEGATKFLNQVQSKAEDADPNLLKGVDTAYGPAYLYGYTVPSEYYYRRCAIGNLCRQFLGWKKEKVQASVECMLNLGGVPPDPHKPYDLYYIYYGTLCTFQQGGDVWKRWNEGLLTLLPPLQVKDGTDNDGSWNIGQDEWGNWWGRVGETAISTLCLEVYYRYLQLTPDK